MNAISASGLRGRFVFVSLLALLAGGAIYLFLRPGEFVFHHWLEAIGLEGLFSPNGSAGSPVRNRLPDWILYSLPNGLWAFAYTFLIIGIWQGSSSPVRYFWFATIPILVFGFELLQLAGVLRGTFSYMDLALSFLGLFTGVFTGIIMHKHQSHEKPLA